MRKFKNLQKCVALFTLLTVGVGMFSIGGNKAEAGSKPIHQIENVIVGDVSFKETEQIEKDYRKSAKNNVNNTDLAQHLLLNMGTRIGEFDNFNFEAELVTSKTAFIPAEEDPEKRPLNPRDGKGTVINEQKPVI